MLSMRIETHRRSMAPHFRCQTSLSSASAVVARLSARLRRGRLLIVVAMAGLGLTACVGDVPEVPPGDAQLVQGREVYSRNCVGCHGADGGGGTGTKLNEGVVVEQFPDPATAVEIVADGRNQMPAFAGKLTDDEIEAVVRFTREGL